MAKCSRALSRVKWLRGEKPNVSTTNVGFLTAQPFDPANSPRELHHTQSPGKQQISERLLVAQPGIRSVEFDTLKESMK
jgi:hypothetical protein